MKLSTYVIPILLIVAAFLGGYYFASYNISKKALTEKLEEALVPTIQLKPGELENLLHGTIISIDTTKIPAEILILVTVNPDRFVIPPPFNLQKTVLVPPHTRIVMGKAGAEETVDIDITELKRGDDIVVRTAESILDILTRETYAGTLVRKIIF